MTVQLNEEAHEYSDELGRRVDGVTETLHIGGVCDEITWSEHSRWRGSAVHKATLYHDEGDLRESSLSDEIRAFVDQWKRARAAHPFEILSMETVVYHKRFGYAGRYDRLVRMLSGPWKGKRAIWDIKSSITGYVAPCAAIQTAGYGNAVPHANDYLWPRFACALTPDKHDLKIYPPELYMDDLDTFYATLKIARWRAKHL